MSDNLPVITENMGKAGQIGYCTHKPEHFRHLGWLQSVQIIHDNNEPRQPGGCKLKTAPVRPVVAARPAEYVCSEDLFY
ncbi:hypothetical protein [Escherichia coli]|uniref:hypothetical protein n=1 Tax=Escherichia coli TaxID=562 RepID=UPI00234C7165|nr:hypothetical protein [Escherichia coli]WBZ42161.1 hypothetical protein PIC84_24515 [Escherichia coli]